MRNTTRLLSDHATPQSAEPAANSARAKVHSARAPKRSSPQPTSGIPTVVARR